MNIKPILFSTEMVRSILKGDKKQTRRIAKWNKSITAAKVGFTAFCGEGEFSVRGIHENGENGESLFSLPFKKGDVMWVRETFSKKEERLIYRADVCGKWDLPDGYKWKPSIFMPKEVCRIFLKVTKVRIEKLHNISERDSSGEGIRVVTNYDTVKSGFLNTKRTDNRLFNTAKEAFRDLWICINGQKSWDENPFVYVYDFEKVERPIEFMK